MKPEASTDRIERLLAVMLLHSMKSSSQADKAVQLSLAGFSSVEIADLLQTNQAVVRQMLYLERKKTKKKAR